MRFGSVCSGIEAASVAWEPLGWQAAWFAEIEPFPSAVLKYHYANVPNLGDMTRLPEMIRAGDVEAPEVFCGGTPCQAFSVAGLRKSLDDARGNLSLTFCEIANAIDHVRRDRGDQPCVVFWENVPGVLSTKDNAFGCFLAGLAGEDDALVPPGGKWTDAGVVLGPARAVAWRVLDAQYFGLAQRRRRVFVVASAREGFDPAAVLLEFEGVRRDSAPSRETRKVAPTIPSRSTGGGGLGTDFDLDGGLIRRCGFCRNFFDKYRCNAPDECDCPRCQGMCECHAMTASTYCIKGAAIGRKPEAGSQHGEVLEEACYTLNCVDQHAVAMCLNAKGGAGRLDAESETLIPTNGGVFDVTHTLRGEGFDASEDGTGRGTPLVPVIAGTLKANNGGGGWSNSADHAAAGYMVPVHAFDARQSDVLQYGDKTGPLDTDGHSVGVAIPIDTMNHLGRGDSHSFGDFQPGAPSYTLTKSHSHAVAVAVRTANTSANGHGISAELAHTLDQAQGQAVAFTQNSRSEVRQIGGDGQIVGALAADSGAQQQNYVAQAVLAPTLTATNDPSRSPQSSEVTAQVAAVVQATAWSIMPQNSGRDYKARPVDVMQPLMAAGPQHGNQGGDIIQTAMQVRRLMPVECERLQGFPDHYTAIPWRGKPASECPDGPRYKALGNSWAVPVVRWIGRRIANAVAGAAA